MALNNKDLTNYGKLGFIAAIATGFILKLISQLVSMIPGVELDLQAITISTTGLTNVIGTGLGDYAKKLFGLINAPITMPEWIFIGIGGAAFLILGAYVADAMKLLKGDKAKQLTTIFVIAGVASGWILSMSIGIPAISGIIAMVVNAYILSIILIKVDKAFKLKMV